MIKTLQKKFVKTSMIAITLLLIALLGGINLANVWTTMQRTDGLAEDLLSREIKKPDDIGESGRQNEPSEEGFNESFTDAVPENEAHQEDGVNSRGFFKPAPGEKDRMAALFFVARVDENGNEMVVDAQRIATVTEEEAKTLVRQELTAGKEKGVSGNYLYRRMKTSPGYAYVFVDLSLEKAGIVRVAVFSLLAGVACWGMMFVIVSLLSKRAIRPIAENIERQKQFVTDAGHEIKTPLAIILSNTEAMELYQGESKWSRNIAEQVERLNGLTKTLLSLARMEEGVQREEMQNLNLSELLDESVDMFREAAALKDIVVENEISPDVMREASKEQMNRLFSVLLDNAVKYSKEESCILVTLSRQGEKTKIFIENACDKLPDCKPEKLFDRFFRGNVARTQEGGGYGIGLSAAKAIVELYGGEIKATYEKENRIRFTIVM